MDKQVLDLINLESVRQNEGIELIASENYASKDVREVCGSILTNKYAEGYPSRRYYGGCEFVDKIEQLAIDRACKLFECKYANVQPHSGSQANAAAYRALLPEGGKILSLVLNDGGHLTHGHHLNFSGINYNFVSYGVDKETEMIDYDELERIAIESKPKLIVSGASAYPRIIDFKRIREICDKVGAYMMVDMAHIAGLVATGHHISPVPYADFVTSTTHKTLRGPRGGIILCKKEYAPLIDKRVFPGMQGGPLEHIIAAKAICFKEAMSDEYKEYIGQVIKNMKVLCASLSEEGFRIVSGGSDNHLCLVDLRNGCSLNGKQAETILDRVNITCNKNSIPFDPEKPAYCSGIRLGTAAMTSRGFKEEEFYTVGKFIARALKNPDNEEILDSIKNDVLIMLKNYPYNID